MRKRFQAELSRPSVALDPNQVYKNREKGEWLVMILVEGLSIFLQLVFVRLGSVRVFHVTHCATQQRLGGRFDGVIICSL